MRHHIPLVSRILCYITLFAALSGACDALKTREQLLAFLSDASGVPVFERVERPGNESFIGDVDDKDTLLSSKRRLGVRFVSGRTCFVEADEVRGLVPFSKEGSSSKLIQFTALQIICSNVSCGSPSHLALLDSRGNKGTRQTFRDRPAH
jgi:hypothetical protein